MARGRFITFEGGEGVGKSTQVWMLTEALRKTGQQVLSTREPGGAPNSEALRPLLLKLTPVWSPLAETLLHFAARAEHVAKIIEPELEEGRWVVCDRFFDSTIAYQGSGEQVSRHVIDTLIGFIGLTPDLTIVLDAPDEISRNRARARGGDPDHYEIQPIDFHTRVNAAFRAIAAEQPERCVLIQAAPPADEVHRAVLAAVDARLRPAP